ncbi:hypothetical protein BLA29_011039 [Euroglyphus maynei]|uniref:Uncharacterized protein n=1 Tax=Euroglyphus maynei TaxID=6958 RepID=A0A1Y3AS59_EURMA|nr:hypothetical protein BLA29_011039 [Euroglyphus maynei]
MDEISESLPLDEHSLDDYLEDDLDTTVHENGEKTFQKINLYDNCLPYREQLELIRMEYWQNLKNNLYLIIMAISYPNG